MFDQLKMVLKTLIRKIFAPVVVFKMTCTLKGPKQGVNILCIQPAVVVGGAEKIHWDIVNGLSNEKYHFHLLSQKKQNNPWCRRFLKAFSNTVLFDNALLERVFYKNVLQKVIEKLDIKVILVSNVRQVYHYFPWIKEKYPHIKLIDLVHAIHPGYMEKYLHPMISCLDHRICVNENIKNFILELSTSAKLDARHLKGITFIYNGSDTAKFQRNPTLNGIFRKDHGIRPEVKIISFVARFSEEKRPLLFIDIAHRTIQQYKGSDIMFVMGGDGREMAAVKARIAQYHLQDKFVLTGMIEYEQVIELLNESYAFLITSELEGGPLTLLEAMSMNVPVISTDVGFVERVIEHGTNGFITRLDDDVIKNASDILLELLNSPERQRSIAKICRESVVEKYSLGNMIKQYRDLFTHLCV